MFKCHFDNVTGVHLAATKSWVFAAIQSDDARHSMVVINRQTKTLDHELSMKDRPSGITALEVDGETSVLVATPDHSSIGVHRFIFRDNTLKPKSFQRLKDTRLVGATDVAFSGPNAIIVAVNSQSHGQQLVHVNRETWAVVSTINLDNSVANLASGPGSSCVAVDAANFSIQVTIFDFSKEQELVSSHREPLFCKDKHTPFAFIDRNGADMLTVQPLSDCALVSRFGQTPADVNAHQLNLEHGEGYVAGLGFDNTILLAVPTPASTSRVQLQAYTLPPPILSKATFSSLFDCVKKDDPAGLDKRLRGLTHPISRKAVAVGHRQTPHHNRTLLQITVQRSSFECAEVLLRWLIEEEETVYFAYDRYSSVFAFTKGEEDMNNWFQCFQRVGFSDETWQRICLYEAFSGSPEFALKCLQILPRKYKVGNP